MGSLQAPPHAAALTMPRACLCEPTRRVSRRDITREHGVANHAPLPNRGSGRPPSVSGVLCVCEPEAPHGVTPPLSLVRLT